MSGSTESRPTRVTIRRELERDHEAVFRVHEEAFEQAAEARLVEALREGVEPYVAVVAELDGAIVGHVVFSPVTVADPPPAARQPLLLGLGPMAVAPRHQRAGIGGALIRAGLAACGEIGVAAVFVLGHAEYYPRFGFTSARDAGFRYESDAFDPFFFVLELSSGSLRGLTGMIRYSPPFELL